MGVELITEKAAQYTREQLELLKRTICKGATDDEFQMFAHVSQRTGLDPFARQIHAVKRWDSKLEREVMSIQTGIDGYRLVADRTGKYAGSDDYVFDEGVSQFAMLKSGRKQPVTSTATAYKLVGGQRVPFTATAGWEEYKQTRKDGSLILMWGKMPFLMLGKCAEALALRKAFPAELSGILTDAEMGQADSEGPGPAADHPPISEPLRKSEVARPEPDKPAAEAPGATPSHAATAPPTQTHPALAAPAKSTASASTTQQPPAQPVTGDCISDKQRKRLYAIYKGAGKSDAEVKLHLKRGYGIEHTADIPKNVYEVVCAWAEDKDMNGTETP
jgi:phage recombination protein Bet